VLFAPWLVVLMIGAAGIVEMSIGLHAARIKKPFLLPAHHLYWTRAAMLAVVIFALPRFTYRAPAVNSNAFDAVLLLPIGLAAGCFWMLGRGYAAPGLERCSTRSGRSCERWATTRASPRPDRARTSSYSLEWGPRSSCRRRGGAGPRGYGSSPPAPLRS
jgi:hypothetical protein